MGVNTNYAHGTKQPLSTSKVNGWPSGAHCQHQGFLLVASFLLTNVYYPILWHFDRSMYQQLISCITVVWPWGVRDTISLKFDLDLMDYSPQPWSESPWTPYLDELMDNVGWYGNIEDIELDMACRLVGSFCTFRWWGALFAIIINQRNIDVVWVLMWG